jgi:hypothetical protein
MVKMYQTYQREIGEPRMAGTHVASTNNVNVNVGSLFSMKQSNVQN